MSIEIAEYMTFLIQESLNKVNDAPDCEGGGKSLQKLKDETVRTLNLMQGHSEFRIGVFGPPSRGKSTLLNALIGEKVLPTGPRPGLGKSVIELRYQEGKDWQIKISKPDGQSIKQNYDSLDHLYNAIKKQGTAKGIGESEAFIKVSGPFDKCELLKKGFSLVDTPGAELAFEGDDEDVKQDTERALSFLDKTHLILFCMRSDQIGSRTEFNMYSQDMWQRQPLNVVNFWDRWEDSPMSLKNEVAREYGISPEKVSLVSALNAFKGKTQNDQKLLETSLFLEFENTISQQANSMKKGMRLPHIYEDYRELLHDIKKSHSLELQPLTIYSENFRHILNKSDSEIAQKILNSDKV